MLKTIVWYYDFVNLKAGISELFLQLLETEHPTPPMGVSSYNKTNILADA